MIVSTASDSREVTWLCFIAWAMSLNAKFIRSKTGIRREFHTLPKASTKCSRNWVNYTGFLHSCLWLWIRHWHLKGDISLETT